MASQLPQTEFSNPVERAASCVIGLKKAQVEIIGCADLPSALNSLFSFVHSVYLPLLLRHYGLESDAKDIESKGDLLYFEPRNSVKGFKLETSFKAQDVLHAIKRKLGGDFRFEGGAIVLRAVNLTLDAAYYLRELDASIEHDQPSRPSFAAAKHAEDCFDHCCRILEISFGGGMLPSVMLDTASAFADLLAYNEIKFLRQWQVHERALTFPCRDYLRPLCEWSGVEMNLDECNVDCWLASYILSEFAIRIARIGVNTFSGDSQERLHDVTLEPYPSFGIYHRNTAFYAGRASHEANCVYSVFEGRGSMTSSWRKSEAWQSLIREQGEYQARLLSQTLAERFYEAITSAGVAYTIVSLPKLLISIFDILVEAGTDKDWIRAEILRMLMLDFSGVIIED